MATEQAINESDLICDEQPKSQADHTGHEPERPIGPREAIPRIREWQGDRSGDQHHARDGADSKNEQIGHGPPRIPYGRQNKQRYSRRPRKTMHNSHNQRPHDLIKSGGSKVKVKPSQGSLAGLVFERFWILTVGLGTFVASGAVRMRMEFSQRPVRWRKSFCHSLQEPGKIHDSKEDEHQPDRKFHGEANSRRDHPAQQNDASADGDDGERMPQAPEDANQRGILDGAMPGHDRGNRHDVIGIRGVAHPEKESQHNNREQVDHITVNATDSSRPR